MTVSCTISYLWEFEHTYWFPLHAYLLLQPSYEESAHRMVTRPVGTAIGCVLVHLVYPYLPGLPGVFLFSLVMISLMYCCTPGTWVHPIFSTAFALTMATLTVRETEAIWLRLLYLAMAVALVLVVNRFLLPNRRGPQFRRNLQELYQLQSTYWGASGAACASRWTLHCSANFSPSSIWPITKPPSISISFRRNRPPFTGPGWWCFGTCSLNWSRRRASSKPGQSPPQRFPHWTTWQQHWKRVSALCGIWKRCARKDFPRTSFITC